MPDRNIRVSFRVHDIMSESFVLLPAGWTIRHCKDALSNRIFSSLIVRLTVAGATEYYLLEGRDIEKLHESDDTLILEDALSIRNRTPTPVARPETVADDTPATVVVVHNGKVLGYLGETTKVGIDGFPERSALDVGIDSGTSSTVRIGDLTFRSSSESVTGFSAYPSVGIEPSELSAGAEFRVRVWLSRSIADALGTVMPIEIEEVAPDSELLVILRVSGATVVGDAFDSLALKYDSSCEFSCIADETSASVSITAQFFFESEIVGVASRTYDIGDHAATAASRHEFGRRQHSIMPKLVENRVDLTIDLTDADGVLEWWFLSSNPQLREGPFRTQISDTREFAARIDSDLRPRKYRGPWAHSSLLNLGQSISDKMPPELFEILRTMRKAIGRLPRTQLLTNEPFVPWELGLMPDPLLDSSAPPFLAAQTLIARWWIDEQIPYPPPHIQRVGAVTAVASKYGLGSNQRELKEALAEQQTLHDSYNATKLEATLEDLETVVFGARTPGHVIHFAVHGYSDPNANEEAIILADGQTLRPGELVGSFDFDEVPRFSVVFFNACQVGTAGTRLGQAAGFPGALLRGGACAFIAPLWEVHDTNAREFAEGFYHATLREGLTVSEALRSNRSSYDKSDSTTPIAYIYYGHPELRLVND